MPIFCQKNAKSLKNTLFSCPCFVKQNVHSLKNTLLPCHFFQIFMENPFLSCPYLVKKMSILSKLHYIIGQKVNRIPLFFPNFHDKILLSCPYFIKNCPFSNKHIVLTPIFCQKNVHSLKNSVLASFFSKVS